MNYSDYYKECRLCPRNCGINRFETLGYCRSGEKIKASLSYVHNWEEPPISGIKGSGTVFFTNCNLRCVFCQNYDISQQSFGKEISVSRLSEIFLNLQAKGVHNINLVTPTHFIPSIAEAIKISKSKGLNIPIVYNSGGYEKAESLSLLDGLIDIYLPDIKYYYPETSEKLSNAKDYFKYASQAVLEMRRQVSEDIFDENGIMKKGLIIRHLVLPGARKDSFKILDWIKENLSDDTIISLLRQYTPMYKALEIKEINRKITTFEYMSVIEYFNKLGFKNGFMQEKESAKSVYVPKFDLSGL